MKKLKEKIDSSRNYPKIIDEWNKAIWNELDKMESNTEYSQGLKDAQTLLNYLLNKEREDMFLY